MQKLQRIKIKWDPTTREMSFIDQPNQTIDQPNNTLTEEPIIVCKCYHLLIPLLQFIWRFPSNSGAWELGTMGVYLYCSLFLCCKPYSVSSLSIRAGKRRMLYGFLIT